MTRKRGGVSAETAPAVDEKNASAQAAEKVAKEEPLQLQEDDKYWREFGTAFERIASGPEHGGPREAHRRALSSRWASWAARCRRRDLPRRRLSTSTRSKSLTPVPAHHLYLHLQQPDHPDPKEVGAAARGVLKLCSMIAAA